MEVKHMQYVINVIMYLNTRTKYILFISQYIMIHYMPLSIIIDVSYVLYLSMKKCFLFNKKIKIGM